jgi:hypothetical protein
MGNALYTIRRNGRLLDAGYAVATSCERGACRAPIDRGLDYLCGETPGGTEHGCGGYFCHQHLYTAPEGQTGSLCGRCLIAAHLAEELLADAATAVNDTAGMPADNAHTCAVRVIAAVLPHLAQQALARAAAAPPGTAAHRAGYTAAGLDIARHLLSGLPNEAPPSPES